MDYIALYRKWRPQDFSALVGQEHIKTAISNALTQNRIAHAYLFSGPRGTGKTSTAKILAKAVNCEKGPTTNPCNVCESCTRINQGTSMDVMEIDAASNRGIDEIRDLREKIRFLPVEGQKRIYIIDEVHMMTTEAFNALLKTLEEPPAHVLFILATTEPHKLPATILSRCQRYDFRRLSIPEMVERLKEVAQGGELKVTDEALKLIAAQSDGGMRDALSLLDQCSVMSEGEITEETIRALLGIVGKEMLRGLVTAVAEKDKGKALEMLDSLLLAGRDIKQLISEMSMYFRAIMLCKVSNEFTDIYITDSKENLEVFAEKFSMQQIIEITKILHSSSLDLRSYVQPRIIMEMCLMELCSVSEALEQKELLLRIENLEKLVAGGKIIAAEMPEVKTPVVKKEEPKAEIKIPKEIKKPETVQEKAETEIPPAVKVPEPDEVPSTANEDDNQLWEKILSNVLSQNKKSLHACAKNGRMRTLENGVVTVEFETTFACERMQKDDYKKVIEDTIMELTGTAMQLKCIATDIAAKPVKVAKRAEEPPAREQLPDAVAAALEVFGGQVVKIKNKE